MLPWLDRKGRLSPLRASVFALLWVPGLVYAGRFALRDLGPRPLHEALLAAGAWTIWWLLASLAVTPVKAVFGLPGIVVVRRMVGLAALAYGVLHLTLYAADENWRLLHVGAEIVSRFYLIVGVTSLAGLAALGGAGAWMPGCPDPEGAGVFPPCHSSTTPHVAITFHGRATRSRTGLPTRRDYAGGVT